MYHKYFTKRFNKSLKKIIHSGKISKLEIEEAINTLAKEEKLPIKYKDHVLQGSYEGLRESHIKPNILLVYQIKKNQMVLIILDINSHSELF